MKQIENLLQDKQISHEKHDIAKADELECYLKSDEPMIPITREKLDEFDPQLKDLYKKYMSEYIVD